MRTRLVASGVPADDVDDDWLEQQLAAGASLTNGLVSSPLATAWLGDRLLWWTRPPLPTFPRPTLVGFASSRLGRDLTPRADWFRVLRAVCDRLAPRDDVLLTAHGSTTARFVRRCESLFGVRSLELSVSENNRETVADWWRKTVRSATANSQTRDVLVSPPLSPALTSTEPNRDRAVIAWAERLFVSHVRPHGHMHRLLCERLRSGLSPLGSVYVAVGSGLADPEVARELLSLGAVGWLVAGAFSPSDLPGKKEVAMEWNSIPLTGDYLTHCTRQHDGPWPGQTESDYLDDLLLGRPDADHTAFSALRRIVAGRRIEASSQLIRGGVSVVAFTAVPPRELPAHRIFRRHRARWDFEPYGISIHQDWLVTRGARPVHYGDEETWQRLPESNRPFFQRQFTRGRGNAPRIDWSTEQEWRVVGSVDLHDLPSSLAVVFVASAREAALLQPECPWPVVVSPDG